MSNNEIAPSINNSDNILPNNLNPFGVNIKSLIDQFFDGFVRYNADELMNYPGLVIKDGPSLGQRLFLDSNHNCIFEDVTYTVNSYSALSPVHEQTTIQPDGGRIVERQDENRNTTIECFNPNQIHPFKRLEIKRGEYFFTLLDEKSGAPLRTIGFDNLSEHSASIFHYYETGAKKDRFVYRFLSDEKIFQTFLADESFDEFAIQKQFVFYSDMSLAKSVEYQNQLPVEEMEYFPGNIQPRNKLAFLKSKKTTIYYPDTDIIKEQTIKKDGLITFLSFDQTGALESELVIDELTGLKVEQNNLPDGRQEIICRDANSQGFKKLVRDEDHRLIEMSVYADANTILERTLFTENDEKIVLSYNSDNSYFIITKENGLIIKKHYFEDDTLDYEEVRDEDGKLKKISYMNQYGIDHSLEYLSNGTSFPATYVNGIIASYHFEPTNGATGVREVFFKDENGMIKRRIAYNEDGSRIVTNYQKGSYLIANIVTENKDHEVISVVSMHPQTEKKAFERNNYKANGSFTQTNYDLNGHITSSFDIIYNEDKSYTKVNYDANGRKRSVMKFSAKHTLLEQIFYFSTGAVAGKDIYNSATGFMKESFRYRRDEVFLHKQFDEFGHLLLSEGLCFVDKIKRRFKSVYNLDAVGDDIFMEHSLSSLDNVLLSKSQYVRRDQDDEKPVKLKGSLENLALTLKQKENYFDDGETLSSVFKYDALTGRLDENITYFPNKEISCILERTSEREHSYTFFTSDKKMVLKREYNSFGLFKEISYYPDGKTPRRTIVYDHNKVPYQELVYDKTGALLDQYNLTKLNTKKIYKPGSDIILQCEEDYTSNVQPRLVSRRLYDDRGRLTTRQVFSQTGALQSVTFYDERQMPVVQQEYDENGRLLYQKTTNADNEIWIERLEEGGFKRTTYDRHHLLKSEEILSKKKEILSVKLYSDLGILASITELENGQIKSTTRYDKTGKIAKSRLEYENGVPKRRLRLGADGAVLKTKILDDKAHKR